MTFNGVLWGIRAFHDNIRERFKLLQAVEGLKRHLQGRFMSISGQLWYPNHGTPLYPPPFQPLEFLGSPLSLFGSHLKSL